MTRHSCKSPDCVVCSLSPVPEKDLTATEYGDQLPPNFDTLFEQTYEAVKAYKAPGVKSLRFMMRVMFYAGTIANVRDLRAAPDPALPEDVAEAVRAVQGELFQPRDPVGSAAGTAERADAAGPTK